MYTHLTPVCNPKGQQSGLEGYILSNSVANLSYVGISDMGTLNKASFTSN